MIGEKLYKNNKSDMNKYTDCAVWCNANNATIEDKGEYYEIVEIKPYVPTKEEQVVQLDLEYEKSKQQLIQYYFEFSIAGNSEGMKSIKVEIDNLNKQYDAELEALKGGE